MEQRPAPPCPCLPPAVPTVGRYIALSLGPGPGRRMITSSAHATATAVGIRDLVRQLAREHGAQRLHLLLAVPHGLALLLGHLWDRMLPTLGYEDLGAENAYQPAFLYQTELVVSVDTVKRHVSHLLSKFGAANRVQGVARARQLGLPP
ncbi:MAG TPA: SAVED domain-containing protein [Actinomycetota bacterium]|nr:SAVED domain-containing protein [Actinomycetota bacterium]